MVSKLRLLMGDSRAFQRGRRYQWRVKIRGVQDTQIRPEAGANDLADLLATVRAVTRIFAEANAPKGQQALAHLHQVVAILERLGRQ